MRSSEVQNFNLFAIRNKKLKFFAFGNGLRSNAFRTTQSAHSALVLLVPVLSAPVLPPPVLLAIMLQAPVLLALPVCTLFCRELGNITNRTMMVLIFWI